MKNKRMQRHIHNLKKSAGLPGNGMIKYEYIYTKDQLQDDYLKRMDDLGYPLRVEPKRDRYVMNSKALEKALEETAVNVLKEIEDELNDFVEKEVFDVITREAANLMNTVVFSENDGRYVVKRKHIIKIDWAKRLGRLLGKELVKTVTKILKDTTSARKR